MIGLYILFGASGGGLLMLAIVWKWTVKPLQESAKMFAQKAALYSTLSRRLAEELRAAEASRDVHHLTHRN